MASALRSLMPAFVNAGAFLRRVAGAIGGEPGFPGVSEVYERNLWPEPQHALDFPKAAALVPTVYACLNRIAQDVAAVPPTFWEGDPEDRRRVKRESGNVVDLYARANPVESGYEVERDRQWSCDQNGNGYLFLDDFNRPKDPGAWELWNLPGHLMRPVAGPRRTVKEYHFGVVGSGKIVDPAHVIAFRYANPNFDPLEPAPIGLSPLEAARQSYETRYNMGAWQSSFYRKGGTVAHIYSIEDAASVTDAQIEAMQTKMDTLYTGVRNAFRPAFLRGVKIERAGLTVQEMQFLEAASMTDADICRVYGIPPWMMGIKEEGALGAAGGMVDRMLYWENCLLSRIALRDAILTEQLCPRFGMKSLFCDTDLSRIPAFRARMLEHASKAQALAGRPIFTVNDALRTVDLPESEDPTADALAVPFSMVLGGENRPEPAPAPGSEKEDDDEPEAKDEDPAKEKAANRRAALSDAERRERMRRRADADLQRYERRVAALFRDLFTTQESRAIARMREEAAAAGINMEAKRKAKLALNPDDWFQPGEEDLLRLQSLYTALVAERGEAAAAEIGETLVVDYAAGKWGDFVRAHADRALTLTSETTKAELRESLAKGLESKETFSQLVARVRDVFQGRRANAMTIARTETAAAYNFAAVEAWASAGVEYKEWLTVGDDVVRPEHSVTEAAGPVPMSQPFNVGGFSGMYPGDPSLPVGMTANCRCVAQPLVTGLGLRRYFRRQDAAPSLNGHGKNRLAHLFAKVVAR